MTEDNAPQDFFSWVEETAPRTPLPSWLIVDALPALREADGPPTQIAELLIRCLKKIDDEKHRPLVVEIVGKLELSSFRRFLWSLFEQYAERGKSGKDLWLFDALCELKDDDDAQRVGRYARDFQSRRQYPRAYCCLAVLAKTATTASLSQLDELARRHSSETLRQRSEAALTASAALRGMTREELSDEIIPTYGMSTSGPLRLDFGGRAYYASIDASGALLLADEDGKPRRSLPRPSKTDDPHLAEQAVETAKWIKSSIKEQFPLQSSRLELAMVAGRSWEPSRWRRLFLEHPWMRWLARRIVWGELESRQGRRPSVVNTFRVAEDWSLADAMDEPFEPTGQRRIAVPHPLLLTEEVRAQWRLIFSDYQIEAPFAQIDRELFTPAESEILDNTVDRYAGCAVDGRRILWDLARHGWSAGSFGIAYEHRKVFPSHDVVAVLHHSECPRFQLAEPFEATIRDLVFQPLDDDGDSPRRRLGVGLIDPVVFSEAVRDVDRLAKTGRGMDAGR